MKIKVASVYHLDDEESSESDLENDQSTRHSATRHRDADQSADSGFVDSHASKTKEDRKDYPKILGDAGIL